MPSAALKTAVRLSPDDDRIRTNLGLTLAAAGRTDEALPLLSQSNGDAIGHANLGYLLAASGQFDLARQSIPAGIDSATRSPAGAARWQDWTLTSAIHDLGTNRTRGLAQGLRSTAHPIDVNVNQASTKTIKIPPPVPGDLIPVARAAAEFIAQQRHSAPSASAIPSDLPLPPPL